MSDITTQQALLHLPSLVDLTGDDVEIIVRENDLFVKAFDKMFYCENADVLEEAAKAAAYVVPLEWLELKELYER